ncbi:MAG: hypothetical protein ACYC6M_06685 [Terriglobales bacterium]
MATVAPGQIWREETTGTHYLVVRVYSELFDNYAVLRQTEGEATRRVKLAKNPVQPLPGFVQESGAFHAPGTETK